MSVTKKDTKTKDQKSMNSKKEEPKSTQGAITKKPWNESSPREKVHGVALTAGAALLAGAAVYNAIKK